jgi:hypothetical protein
MSTIRAMIQDRRINVAAPDDLPDGTEVLVQPVPVADRIGIEEAQWRDDDESLADWAAWLKTIEPIRFAEPDSFDAEFGRFNVEAVRRQMSGDGA